MGMVAVLSMALTACGAGAVASESAATAGQASEHVRRVGASGSLIVADGDLVTAGGRVVALPGRVARLCLPVPVPMVYRGDLPPSDCAVGVDVIGVDLARLERRREHEGGVEGWAELTGRLRDGVLDVTEQRPRLRGDLTSDRPPCRAPEGGWPVTMEGDNIEVEAVEAYRAKHSGRVQELLMLRPGPRQVVLIVLTPPSRSGLTPSADPSGASTDAEMVARVDRALRPIYGDRLCVVPARWTEHDLNATLTDLQRRTADRRLPTHAEGPEVERLPLTSLVQHIDLRYGRDGQPYLRLDVTHADDRLAALADRYPAGLVQLDPWLRPAS